MQYHPEIKEAIALLQSEAEEWVVARAEELVKEGRAEWSLDPQVERVVGLIKPGTKEALLVVYLDERDFEVAAAFDEEAGR